MPKGVYIRTGKHRKILSKNTTFKKGMIRGPMKEETKKKISTANSGSKNGNWTGGKSRKTSGYVYVRKNNKFFSEHRIVMENHIDRPLLKIESVYHKNGIKDDNRIENLELWSGYHPRGTRVKDMLFWAKEILKKYSNIEDKL